MSGKYTRLTEEEKKNKPDEYYLNTTTGKYNKKPIKKPINKPPSLNDFKKTPLIDDDESKSDIEEYNKIVKHNKKVVDETQEGKIVKKIQEFVTRHLVYQNENVFYGAIEDYGLKIAEQNTEKYKYIGKVADEIKSYMKRENIIFFRTGPIIVCLYKYMNGEETLQYKRIGDNWSGVDF